MNKFAAISLIVLVVVSSKHFNQVLAQSNYVQHGDSGNYTTNGLPEEATLDGKVSTILMAICWKLNFEITICGTELWPIRVCAVTCRAARYLHYYIRKRRTNERSKLNSIAIIISLVNRRLTLNHQRILSECNYDEKLASLSIFSLYVKNLKGEGFAVSPSG